jgi:Zn-dependent protease
MLTFVVVCFLWVFSVCLHEFAHASVAYRGGDTSVADKGYLSFNPLAYLDPVTSVLMPLLIVILGGLGLPGAAVYIETHRLRTRWWETAVALAGPAANLLVLFVIALLFAVTDLARSDLAPALAFFALLQASAVVLNLLPIPGFDGFGAIAPHLPYELRARLMQYATPIMLGFVVLLIAVRPFGRVFFTTAVLMANAVGIPLFQVIEGVQRFRFWE